MTRLYTAVLASLIFISGQVHAQRSYSNPSGHIDSVNIYKLYYIPFEVTAGTTEVRVQEHYTSPGKNVLNMGVFDANGYASGKQKGFRGWSGGAKTEFFINEHEASTGYVAGKIKPGTWYVLIYASTIVKQGIDWQLNIMLSKGSHKQMFKPSFAKTYINNSPGWYAGDLHMHTLHSDGKRTTQELTNEAAAKHLNYIISTEHNTNSANLMWGNTAKDSMLVINGEEVTTTAFGHWNAIGIKPQTWIDWRYKPEDSVIQHHIDQVHRDGGLCIINHPFYTPDMSNGFLFDANLFDGIEVWNGNWDALDGLALKWWDSFLQQGKHVLAIGASDTHKSTGSPNNLGVPQTVVHASSLSQKAILQGLKRGKAYITTLPDLKLSLIAKSKHNTANIGEILHIDADDRMEMNLSMMPVTNATIYIIGAQGIIKSVKATDSEYRWLLKPETSGYIRMELRDGNKQMLALTNPIWLDVR